MLSLPQTQLPTYSHSVFSEHGSCPDLRSIGMAKRIRLGVIVPSSNTALEPLTYAMVASIQDPSLDITVHFARFRVTKIDISDESNSQFVPEHLIAAAQLLADAGVDVIGWSGTSAGWMGFQQDEALCEAIHRETGIPATTSVLAFNECLQLIKARDVGLVTPYVAQVNDRIRSNYCRLGFDIMQARDRCLGLTTNSSFGEVNESKLDEMVDGVVRAGGKTVLIYCTNLKAAQRTDLWERKHDCIVLDSVSTVLWSMLRLKGIDTACIQAWGSLFNVS